MANRSLPMSLSAPSLQAKNLLVAGALTLFVGGVYVYTMRAVGGQDDIGEAVKKLEKKEAEESSSNYGSDDESGEEEDRQEPSRQASIAKSGLQEDASLGRSIGSAPEADKGSHISKPFSFSLPPPSGGGLTGGGGLSKSFPSPQPPLSSASGAKAPSFDKEASEYEEQNPRQPLFRSLPAPKVSKGPLLGSLPPPKGKGGDAAKGRRMVSFQPPVNASLLGREEDEDRQAKKKAKQGATPSEGKSGLAAFLPPPKHASTLGGGLGQGGRRTMMETASSATDLSASRSSENLSSPGNPANRTAGEHASHLAQPYAATPAPDSSQPGPEQTGAWGHDRMTTGMHPHAQQDAVLASTGGYQASAEPNYLADLGQAWGTGPGPHASGEYQQQYAAYGGYPPEAGHNAAGHQPGQYHPSHMESQSGLPPYAGAGFPGQGQVAAYDTVGAGTAGEASDPLEQALAAERRRGGREIASVQIKEVKQQDLTRGHVREDQLRATGIAFGPAYQAAPTGKDKPSKMNRRKHQIGSLYYDMRQKEMELVERRAKGQLTKAETHAKYGW